MQKTRVAVVTIGGTFFMKGKTRRSGETFLPSLDRPFRETHARELFEKDTPLKPSDVDITHVPLMNIDSSCVLPDHLNALGLKLTELSNDKRVDAIVVVSGTDKMHRIVTRLAYHVNNLKKPVVFTGAQKPISEQGSDAPLNYLRSVRAAVDLAKHGVCTIALCFGRGDPSKPADLHHPLNSLKAEADKMTRFTTRLSGLLAPSLGATG